MRRIRVAMCQIRTTVGDLDANVEHILEGMAQAEDAGSDVAVFPELAVCGYPPEDLLFKPGFVADCAIATRRVIEATGDTMVVFGSVDGDRDLFNTAFMARRGREVLRYHKRVLPNYGVFDERRYFTPGSDPFVLLELAGVRVGVAICEDLWSATGPVTELARGGADVVLVPNGSPFRLGKAELRDSMLRARSADNSTALVYVNQVGGQDELVFDGGSATFDHTGRLVARSPQFETAVDVLDLQVPAGYRKRRLDPRGQTDASQPLPVIASEPEDYHPAPRPPREGRVHPTLGPEEQRWRALVMGTRDYVEKNGFSQVGVALSGGVDSSLVVAIAADALGPEQVHAVLMPSRFSSDHSVSDAVSLCQRLGVEHRTIPIEPAHGALLDMLDPSFGGTEADTTEENLQSRIRGLLMMALSNKFGWLILTTGNKSESAVGYSTLYGDTAGGFAVIKDLYKTEVYELCHWRNLQEEDGVIPETVLTKPPSAELRPDQRDDQSLPPYEVLDAVLEAYIEHDRSVSEIVAQGFDPALVERIARLVDVAEYKRRQSPPGVRMTSKAFGRDRRMPITNRYRS